MSFFQNVFGQQFMGSLVLGDRQYSMTFSVPAARNQTDLMTSGNGEPYDLSGSNATLTINFAIDRDFKRFAALAINIAGAAASATTATEIVTTLNANAGFSSRFEAFAEPTARGSSVLYVTIRSKNPKVAQKTYISNSSAETKLRFNRYAGVAEAPAYFHRHTIANRHSFSDSLGMLIPLSHIITGNTVASPTVITSPAHGLTTGDTILIANSNSSPTIDGSRVVTVIDADTFSVGVAVTTAGTRGEWMAADEQTMINAAGFVAADVKTDWELFRGRSGIFNFKKQTVDGSNRITQIIEYPAGALAGDFAKITLYTYSGANTSPSTITEIPYTLLSGDIVTPP